MDPSIPVIDLTSPTPSPPSSPHQYQHSSSSKTPATSAPPTLPAHLHSSATATATADSRSQSSQPLLQVPPKKLRLKLSKTTSMSAQQTPPPPNGSPTSTGSSLTTAPSHLSTPSDLSLSSPTPANARPSVFTTPSHLLTEAQRRRKNNRTRRPRRISDLTISQLGPPADRMKRIVDKNLVAKTYLTNLVNEMTANSKRATEIENIGWKIGAERQLRKSDREAAAAAKEEEEGAAKEIKKAAKSRKNAREKAKKKAIKAAMKKGEEGVDGGDAAPSGAVDEFAVQAPESVAGSVAESFAETVAGASEPTTDGMSGIEEARPVAEDLAVNPKSRAGTRISERVAQADRDAIKATEDKEADFQRRVAELAASRKGHCMTPPSLVEEYLECAKRVREIKVQADVWHVYINTGKWPKRSEWAQKLLDRGMVDDDLLDNHDSSEDSDDPLAGEEEKKNEDDEEDEEELDMGPNSIPSTDKGKGKEVETSSMSMD